MRKFALGFISFPLVVFVVVFLDRFGESRRAAKWLKKSAYSKSLLEQMTPEARARLILLDSTKG